MATGGGTHSRDWSWRISVADIARNGPFSVFPGMDRHLTLIEGRGLVLNGTVGSLRLEQVGDFVVFPGERSLQVELIDGPVRVWNVITKRGSATGTIRVDRGAVVGRSVPDGDCGAALVLDGVCAMRCRGSPDEHLLAGDGFCWEGCADPPALMPASARDVALLTTIRLNPVTQL